MSKITIYVSSNCKNKSLKDLSEYYLKLAKPYISLEIKSYGQAKTSGKSKNDIDQALQQEANWIEKNLSTRGHTYLMTEHGPSYSTEKLSELFQNWLEKHEKLQFVFGGAYGLHSSLYIPQRTQLSLSPMTLPHEISLVIFLEQLYRLMTISSGKRYHY